MKVRTALAVVAAVVSCGVSPAAAPIPVEGTETDRAALVGDWAGGYASDDGVTRGTIAFRLRSGADSAHGQAEISLPASPQPCGEPPPAAGEVTRHPCTVIDIQSIRISGDSVRGLLPPFWNPGCECRSTALFDGLLGRGRITGRFTMRTESGDSVIATGRWEVERRPR